MDHLNSATQQTASASEELNATAEELSGQAQQLQALVNQFKLPQTPGKRQPMKGANSGFVREASFNHL